MPDRFRILAIHGGGIRGIIPALVLEELERRTGKRVCRLFDLIAGTSTGGILALGLVAPDARGEPRYAATQLVELYEREGRRIFSRPLLHWLRSLGNLLGPKYPPDSLEAVLHRYFGETPLSQALTEVVITAYDLVKSDPWFFRRRRAQESPMTHDFPMRVVARGTAAAPTFFPPLCLRGESPRGHALVDGGMFANNPAMCAYVDAMTRTPAPRDVVLVSIGTGQLERPVLCRRARGWGLIRWAKPALEVMFDGVSDTVDHQLRRLLIRPDGTRGFFDFQLRLDEGNTEMDDTSSENMADLRRKAAQLIANRRAELEAVVPLLG